MARPFWAIQPAFTGGEISEDVASRVDLDKYALALRQAENAVIRPYGNVRKRSGFIHVGEAKTRGGILLKEFDYEDELSYLLEFGAGYVRIWRNGTYIGVECETPFDEQDLKRLRFVQSVDVMYICSGEKPVQKLMRYKDTDWRMETVHFAPPAFSDVNSDTLNQARPDGVSGSVGIETEKNTFTKDMVGEYIKLEQRIETTETKGAVTSDHVPKWADETLAKAQKYIVASEGGNVIIELLVKYDFPKHVIDKHINEDGSTSYTYAEAVSRWETIFYRRVDGSFYEVFDAEKHKIDWQSPETYEGNNAQGQVQETYSRLYLKVTALRGTTTVRAQIQGGSDTITVKEIKAEANSISVGGSWKYISHGTWAGTVHLEYSINNGKTWTKMRTYTSSNDYNPQETGTVEEECLMRIRNEGVSGSIQQSLSSLPYTHTGWGRIVKYVNARKVIVETEKDFGSTKSTPDWYFGAWSDRYGYPVAATFFQDRLCLGGGKRHPTRIWMSKSGDYENFDILKEGGSVTDDSAISADMLSQKYVSVAHMDAGTDLIVFTEGNSWTISGNDTVTPSSITPRRQDSYGTGNITPIRVGSRVVYVQNRGAVARDIGYDYNSDSYHGMDLTLLAKHLVKGHKIEDADFAQEPDSIMYFVRDDGILLCLTYVMEQQVYGWSHIVTDGKILSIASINGKDRDEVYIAVEREAGGEKRVYIERLADEGKKSQLEDYCMMDAAGIVERDTPSHTVTGLERLEGKTVQIVADGKYIGMYVVRKGQAELPTSAQKVTFGLPYKMILETPNWDAGNTESGTVQGRKKTVTEAILRVKNSYGGKIGADQKHLQRILYGTEETAPGSLVTGEVKTTMHEKGVNTEGRVYIEHDTPHPFDMSALIRAVTFLG
ncbi:hypothetical protein TAMA11512_12890 [Selenomonas sp. TAMA-11512]|uniref:hypothetical protein n=1 Tax=Selenomonas sp. TAMA-11512 TaxID=3095337 RepID=UPI00308D03F1|nr:hypothetical protein TAMA11512_12890 [Selenomonas sp. TAMA-11512]